MEMFGDPRLDLGKSALLLDDVDVLSLDAYQPIVELENKSRPASGTAKPANIAASQSLDWQSMLVWLIISL